MPGIFGLIDVKPGAGRSSAERLDTVRRMAAAMLYEPDYVAYVVSSAALSTCAGWVGRCPSESVPDHSQRVWQSALLTAGEPLVESEPAATQLDDYYTAGLGSRELAQHMHVHGVDGLSDVDGSFAGFLMDRAAERCVLFTDRYGVERLFIHRAGHRILFSSEAKAILAVAANGIDPAGLAEWLSCGCTIGTASLYKDIEILTGGSVMTITPGRELTRRRYFDRSMLEQLPQVSRSQFLEQFDHSLASAVKSAVGRSPSAISLTGGLDSRLVLAALEPAPHSVPCYTFGSMYRTTRDVAVARAVADNCEQDHHELTLDRHFVAGIRGHLQQAVAASDGYLGLAGSAELYLNRLAAGVAPARVTGNWGGELMRGVRAFKAQVPAGDFIRTPLRDSMLEVRHAFARMTQQHHPLSFALFEQLPHQGYGRYAVERSQVLMRSPFLANRVVTALYQAPPETRTSIDTVMQILRRRPALAWIPTDLGRLGRRSPAIRAIQQRYRRAVVKAEYLTSHGAPHWLAKVSSQVPFLETAFLGRDKFQHFRLWLRHELAEVVREVLTDDTQVELNAWFDMRRVSEMVDDHIAGRANYTAEIDNVLTLAVLCHTIEGTRTLSLGPSGNACPASMFELSS